MPKTIAILGNHKNLFGKLTEWFNNDSSYSLNVVHKPTTEDLTPVAPDLIFCVYCEDNNDGYWKGIDRTYPAPKIVYGNWGDRNFDAYFLQYSHFASMAWQRSYHIPQGRFTLLPLPIDITEIPNANLDASRPFKVMQSFILSKGSMPVAHNKTAWLIKDVCEYNSIPFELVTNLSKTEAFNKVSSEATLVIDQFWAGEIGMVSWEAMAMGIVPLVWASPDTIVEFTKVFGSFPPLLNLDIGNNTLNKKMELREREAIVRPVLTQTLLDLKNGSIDLIQRGAECRDWMLANYNKQKIMDLYAGLWARFIDWREE